MLDEEYRVLQLTFKEGEDEVEDIPLGWTI